MRKIVFAKFAGVAVSNDGEVREVDIWPAFGRTFYTEYMTSVFALHSARDCRLYDTDVLFFHCRLPQSSYKATMMKTPSFRPFLFNYAVRTKGVRYFHPFPVVYNFIAPYDHRVNVL